MRIRNINFSVVNPIKYSVVFAALTIFEFKYLGPWRKFLISRFVKKSNNKKFQCSNFNDLELNSAKKITENINTHGYSAGGHLSEAAVNAVLSYCNHTKKYDDTQIVKENIPNPHLDSNIINDILHSPAIYNAVKDYLGGVEPILYDSALWIRRDEADLLGKECTREFHYDISDYKSVAMFIYLTDVDQHSAPHVIIKDTHTIPFYKRIFCKLMPAKKAYSLYSNDIIAVTGKAGDIIFEDLLCYHKRSLGNKKRIILVAHYNIQKEKIYSFERTKKFILSLR